MAKKKVNIWDFYDKVQLATQRFVLIKKALGIKVGDFHAEENWIMETFKELEEEGEQGCGYLIVKTYKNGVGKQEMDFYFDLA